MRTRVTWLCAPFCLLAAASGIARDSEETRLLGEEVSAQDRFGFSVAIDRDVAVVGAIFDEINGSESGSAYVFVRSGSIWSQSARLVPDDGGPGDQFGAAVAVHGDTIAVAARFDDDLADRAGSAYVFARSGTTWVQQAKLLASDGAADDLFGVSIALDADTVVVGATQDDDQGGDSGSAYVFHRTGSVWSQQAKLNASDGALGDRFGNAVSVSGNTVAIGAQGDDDNQSGSGSAYIFVRTGTNWSEQAKLLASDGDGLDSFGSAVSVSIDSCAVGARNDEDQGASSGSAYIFTRNGATWSEQAKLLPLDGEIADVFGATLALDADRLVVGAVGDDDNGSSAGAAYVFSRAGTLWSETTKLLASDGEPLDQFGHVVSVSGDTAVVGAPFAAGSGIAFAFRLLDGSETYCTAKPNSCGDTPALGFSGAPSASASSGFTVRGSGARTGRTGIVLYTDAGPAAIPFQGGILCLEPAPLRRSPAVVETGASPGTCDGEFALDWNAFAKGATGGNPAAFLLEVGTLVHLQWWGRDTLANGSYLSDAGRYCVEP